jgi:hypothetical protein
VKVLFSLPARRTGTALIVAAAAFTAGPAGTSNDNLYYTGTPGQIFNPGPGLGVPNLAALAAGFGHP